MGMILTDGQLVVVNQNINTGQSGEIFRFNGTTGTFDSKLVASSDRNAPFTPQGLVRGGPDNAFYVADVNVQAGKCANQGDVKKYSATGAFLGNLDRHNFPAAFYPRGVVFGPDGLLYVSARGCPLATDPNTPLIGYILRFDPKTDAFVDVFASNANTSVPDLHRPEGLVFDRAGNLWVTSFRANKTDSDRILKLDGKTGLQLDSIVLSNPLSTPPEPRAFAQALVFGPEGNLFIPITGDDPLTAGQVRRCNPNTKACDVIVPANSAGGALVNPWFLIFRKSDPATLNYRSND